MSIKVGTQKGLRGELSYINGKWHLVIMDDEIEILRETHSNYADASDSAYNFLTRFNDGNL